MLQEMLFQLPFILEVLEFDFTDSNIQFLLDSTES